MKGMKSVKVATFLERLEAGAVAFDTRTAAQFARDGLEGTGLLTLAEVQAGSLPDLPKGTPIYLICERGQISELVGLYLETAGFTDVYNVAGGFIMLRAEKERSFLSK